MAASKPAEVGVSEARDKLPVLVNNARWNDEETILTHYGTPVAKIVPLDAEDKT